MAFSTLAMLAPIAAVASAWLISPMWSPDFPVLVATAWGGAMVPVLVVVVAMLPPGLPGWSRHLLAGTAWLGLSGWVVASAVAKAEVGRALTNADVAQLFREPVQRHFLMSQLIRGEVLAAIVVVAAIYGLAAWSGTRWLRVRQRLVLGLLLAAVPVLVTGALLWEDAILRLITEPGLAWTAPLWDWRPLTGLAFLVGGAWAGWRGFAIARGPIRYGAVVLMLMLSYVTGAVIAAPCWWGAAMVRAQGAVSAPWAVGKHLASVTGIRSLGAVTPAAWLGGIAALRHDLGRPFWAPGPEPAIAALAGRYRDRSCVVIVMESQRLAEVADVCQGANGYGPLSRELGKLAKSGLWFTNWTTTGENTIAAHLALLLGQCVTPSFIDLEGDYGHQAVGYGRTPDFPRAGYRCDWLMATDPRFDGLVNYLAVAGFSSDITPLELRGRSRDHWTVWGMPDDQLLGIALDRCRRWAEAGTRHLTVVATVSNHTPYLLPAVEGEDFPNDRAGGIAFADRCVGRFMAGIRAIAPEHRPLVLITADHGHFREEASGQGGGCEFWRLPGILLLPDDQAAGTVCDMPISSADALDLLWTLVGAPDRDRRRFLDVHRAATCFFTAYSGWWVVTGDRVLDPRTQSVWKLTGLWNRERIEPDDPIWADYRQAVANRSVLLEE